MPTKTAGNDQTYDHYTTRDDGSSQYDDTTTLLWSSALRLPSGDRRSHLPDFVSYMPDHAADDDLYHSIANTTDHSANTDHCVAVSGGLNNGP
jgi:hypothetical protein